MNFQQLRIIREAARRDFNFTEVANALYTSQSGVSKHIKDLEDELGVELFIRRGKRILGLTEPGKELLTIVERMLVDAQNIRTLADHFSNSHSGNLSVATTHTQARYALPKIVQAFKAEFPKVHLVLHQGSPDEIASLLLSGEADIGIATERLSEVAELATFPFYSWHHAVLVPRGHPLDTDQPLTLEEIAAHPIVTYHQGYTGRALIDAAFAERGLLPDVVMSALDADVIKAYVELGMGIGIIAPMAFDERRDSEFRLRPADHLFASNTTVIAVRRNHYLRGYAFRFIEGCNAELSEVAVRAQQAMLVD